MKEKAIITFTNNVLSGYTDYAIEILEPDIISLSNCGIEMVFSNETALHLKNLHDGTTNEKLGFQTGAIMDAIVSKTTAPKCEKLSIEFLNAKGIQPLKSKEQLELTQFEKILSVNLKNIENQLNLIKTSKNKKNLLTVLNEINSMLTKTRVFIEYIDKNNISNAEDGFCYIDLWDFMKEIENNILSIGNVEIENIPCSAFRTCMKKTAAKDIVLSAVTAYVSKEERAYVKCFRVENNATIRIANFKSSDNLEYLNDIRFPLDNLKAIIDLQANALKAHIGFKHYMYKENRSEILLTFGSDKVDKLYES